MLDIYSRQSYTYAFAPHDDITVLELAEIVSIVIGMTSQHVTSEGIEKLIEHIKTIRNVDISRHFKKMTLAEVEEMQKGKGD